MSAAPQKSLRKPKAQTRKILLFQRYVRFSMCRHFMATYSTKLSMRKFAGRSRSQSSVGYSQKNHRGKRTLYNRMFGRTLRSTSFLCDARKDRRSKLPGGEKGKQKAVSAPGGQSGGEENDSNTARTSGAGHWGGEPCRGVGCSVDSFYDKATFLQGGDDAADVIFVVGLAGDGELDFFEAVRDHGLIVVETDDVGVLFG